MEALIPVTLFICTFALVFGIRYFSNKEKMAMIERGIDPGIGQAQPRPYISLKWGLLLVGVGIGLLASLLLQKTVFANSPDNESLPALYFGFIGIFGGLGLITSFLIEKKTLDK